MKRRQEVILKVLQWLEDRQSPWNDLPETLADPVNGELMDPAVIRYHIDLCEQAGFIRMNGTKDPQIQLTWTGHEELEARRNR
jgi:repressor of nif and glnA expression